MTVSKPKSAKRGVPFWSINMFAFKGIKIEIRFRQSETYTLEIPMDHSLVVNVDRALGNALQLEGFLGVTETRMERIQGQNLRA